MAFAISLKDSDRRPISSFDLTSMVWSYLPLLNATAPSVKRLKGLIILRLIITEVTMTASPAITVTMVIILRLRVTLSLISCLLLLFVATISLPCSLMLDSIFALVICASL
ncbi:MAG: hypothetical protein A4E57_04934 [Syntrophorhabdaceae bacterium PtaU1.Bin034]|nr:MAG: hypothetical protein A4E57_04934 [Syntrophorhabdaceae bacterium PtaU1.Bin034]